jgi:hypothetical protein
MVVREGKERFDNDEQLTNERELPTSVKLGAEIEVIELEKKPKLLETLLRASKLMD